MLLEITSLKESGLALHPETSYINPEKIDSANRYRFQFSPDTVLYEVYVGNNVYVVHEDEMKRIHKASNLKSEEKKPSSKSKKENKESE